MGIAFTTLAQLRAATGPRQEWLRMGEETLHEVVTPLGVGRIQLDPVLVGPDVRSSQPSYPAQPAFVHERVAVGALRDTRVVGGDDDGGAAVGLSP